MDAALRTSIILLLIYNIVSSFVPSAITQPFFELQTPDFAWKFVGTVPTNYRYGPFDANVACYKFAEMHFLFILAAEKAHRF